MTPFYLTPYTLTPDSQAKADLERLLQKEPLVATQKATKKEADKETQAVRDRMLLRDTLATQKQARESANAAAMGLVRRQVEAASVDQEAAFLEAYTQTKAQAVAQIAASIREMAVQDAVREVREAQGGSLYRAVDRKKEEDAAAMRAYMEAKTREERGLTRKIPKWQQDPLYSKYRAQAMSSRSPTAGPTRRMEPCLGGSASLVEWTPAVVAARIRCLGTPYSDYANAIEKRGCSGAVVCSYPDLSDFLDDLLPAANTRFIHRSAIIQALKPLFTHVRAQRN